MNDVSFVLSRTALVSDNKLFELYLKRQGIPMEDKI